MLTTQFVGGRRARPVEARSDRDAGLIFFVNEIHSAKEGEIEATGASATGNDGCRARTRLLESRQGRAG